MNILFVVHGWPWRHGAGAEWMAHSIAKFLLPRHTVKVAVPNTKWGVHVEDFEGVEITYGATTSDLPKAYEWCDIVFTHLDCSARVFKEAKMAHKPVGYLIHNNRSPKIYNVTANEVALAVFNSRHLMRRYNGSPIPSLMVHPPSHPDRYQVRTMPIRHAVDTRQITLVNLSANKGGALFWELARLHPERQFLGVKGSYGEQIIEGPLPNVTILENTGDMRSVYRQTDILLMASASETWGRVIIEAAWNKIPVIATPTDGPRELLGPVGKYVPAGRVDEWSAAIAELDDDKVYWEYGEALYDRASELYVDTLIQLEALESALLQVTANEPRRLHTVAAEMHYLDHCAATLQTLPPQHRGYTVVRTPELQIRAAHHGVVSICDPNIDKTRMESWAKAFGRQETALFLVASAKDHDALLPSLNIVRVEHGSGQTYTDRQVAFAGGPKHGLLHGFLCPGPHPAKVNKEFHPYTPVYEVGSPQLDPYAWLKSVKSGKVITFSFHWSDSHEVPERRSALPYYREQLPALITTLQGKGWTVWGHGHPRAWDMLSGLWLSLGVRSVRNFEYVMAYSDVYVCDNSSSLFQFSALNKPSVFLNAPWYRRHYSPGLRFWDALDVGLVCEGPEMLLQAINRAEMFQGVHKDLIAKVYTHPAGTSGAAMQDALFMCFERLCGPGVKPAPEVLMVALKAFSDSRAGGRVARGGNFWVDRKTAEDLKRSNLAGEERIWEATPEKMIPRMEPTDLETIRTDIPWDMDRVQLARYWRIRYGWRTPSLNGMCASSPEDPMSLAVTK